MSILSRKFFKNSSLFEIFMLKWFYTGIAQLVEHRSPKPGVGSSSLSARAKIHLFSADLAVFILRLFFASFIFGGFVFWIISFFIAKKVKKENFTLVNFILILLFIIPPLLVIISNTIYLYVINSLCSGETGGYRCATIILNLFFWFYPIHFALALIFAISQKKSKLQKLESQKFKNNSR